MISTVAIDGLAMVGGSLLGIFSKYTAQQQEIKKLKLQLKFKDTKYARKITDKGVQLTRRIIILMFGFSLVLYPLLAAYFHWVLWVPYIETHGGIVAFFKGHDSIVWKQIPNGLALLPIFSMVMIYCITFYFGAGGSTRQ